MKRGMGRMGRMGRMGLVVVAALTMGGGCCSYYVHERARAESEGEREAVAVVNADGRLVIAADLLAPRETFWELLGRKGMERLLALAADAALVWVVGEQLDERWRQKEAAAEATPTEFTVTHVHKVAP